MSRWEWEHGELRLPTADLPRLRKAMQDVDGRIKKGALDRTQEFWKGLTRKQRTDPAAYREALYEWSRSSRPQGRDRWSEPDPVAVESHSEAYDLLHRKVSGGASPSRVLASDVEMPTNRTTRFRVRSDATITFDKESSTVTWDVPSNNHAVDHARSSPMGRAFFDELEKVRWTRGTGGALSGNNEYSSESQDVGGGGNYATDAYGPLGAAIAPFQTRGWTDPKGRRFEVDSRVTRYGFTGRPVEVDRFGNPVKRPRKQAARATTGGSTSTSGTPGVRGRHAAGSSRGGQFASTSAPEADVELEQI